MQTKLLIEVSSGIEKLQPLNLRELDQAYLRGLYADCTQVPLALDDSVDEFHERQPRLHRIYVDLDTTTEPTIEQVFTRLNIPVEEHLTYSRRWQQMLRRQPHEEQDGISLPSACVRHWPRLQCWMCWPAIGRLSF